MHSSRRSARAADITTSTYRLRPRAQADLEEIWQYSSSHWGDERAVEYLRALQSAIERVAANPQLGKAIEKVRRNYRKLSIGSHVIFYRPDREGIEIVRILHARMDFERHL